MNALQAVTLAGAAYTAGMTAASTRFRRRGEEGIARPEFLAALFLVLVAGLVLADRDPRIVIEAAIAIGLGRAGGWTAVRKKQPTKPPAERKEE